VVERFWIAQDLILKPAKDDAALAEKLLVFIPGANVAVSYYTTLMQSIQNQTNLRLWVVVPAMPQQKCIFVCPSYARRIMRVIAHPARCAFSFSAGVCSSSLCSPLHAYVETSVKKAQDLGFKGATTAPDTFMSGHSMGR
jgi:hypothetical protein